MKRYVQYPACYQPYLDMVLDKALREIAEGSVPDFGRDGTPAHLMAVITIERPAPLALLKSAAS